MFLLIVLILFSLCGLLGQLLRKAAALLAGEALKPAKSTSKNKWISQLDLRRAAFSSISFATAKNMIASGYHAIANAAGCFVTLGKPSFCNLGSKKKLSLASRSPYARKREPSRGKKSIMQDFGDAIKCTVTVIL